jgi:hypothetical protein
MACELCYDLIQKAKYHDVPWAMACELCYDLIQKAKYHDVSWAMTCDFAMISSKK